MRPRSPAPTTARAGVRQPERAVGVDTHPQPTPLMNTPLATFLVIHRLSPPRLVAQLPQRIRRGRAQQHLLGLRIGGRAGHHLTRLLIRQAPGPEAPRSWPADRRAARPSRNLALASAIEVPIRRANQCAADRSALPSRHASVSATRAANNVSAALANRFTSDNTSNMANASPPRTHPAPHRPPTPARSLPRHIRRYEHVFECSGSAHRCGNRYFAVLFADYRSVGIRHTRREAR